MQQNNSQPWYVIMTANPELFPLKVYEIEHGAAANVQELMPEVRRLLVAGHDVQIVKRKWEITTRNHVWYSHAQYNDDLDKAAHRQEL
jgi:hypothetical protein